MTNLVVLLATRRKNNIVVVVGISISTDTDRVAVTLMQSSPTLRSFSTTCFSVMHLPVIARPNNKDISIVQTK